MRFHQFIWLPVIAALCGVVVVETTTSQALRARVPLRLADQNQTITGQVLPVGSQRRIFLDRYCVGCHNARLRTGGLALDSADIDQPAEEPEIWEKVLYKLHTNQMPPAGRPRPVQADLDSVIAWLTSELDREAAAHPNPGRVPIHRLNRAEYVNAVRDLLTLDIDGAALLPADEPDREGFDNSAAGLSVSPSLLERYLSAARTISRLALGTSQFSPVFDSFRVPQRFTQDRRASEDLPFGSRGGITINHLFPVDAEYVVKVRLRRQIYDYIVGMGSRQLLDVRIDGALVKRFEIGGEDHGLPSPHTWTGQIVGDPEWEFYMHHADDQLEVRVPVKAGPRRVGISFVDRPSVAEGVAQPPQRGFGEVNDEQYDGDAAVDTVAIGGPYNVAGPGDTPSRRQVLTCVPASFNDQQACATQIALALARRAFRRPVTSRDIEPLLAAFNENKAEGFYSGIQALIERLLVSPEFLFRIERQPADAKSSVALKLSDFELASRLAFFLWSSIPDDELLKVAGTGTLQQPAVLQRQVRRMLDSPKAVALVDNFAAQWLGLRKIRTVSPDLRQFPDWDDNLKEDFERETELFVRSQLQENRSILDLLTADYSFLNERLARHYGVPGIYGSQFRKVAFASHTRGGLLGQGSVLTVSSYPDRTSPVLRGKWVLDNILGMPPPPPPPDVPPLKDDSKDRRLPMRARMEEHRKNPACAVCHVRMDPVGFSLENFDGIGAWRNRAEGAPIDAAGVFPDGTRFEGLPGLRSMLVAHKDDFISTFTAKMLTYAVGRPLEYYDQPAVRSIVRSAMPDGARWSSIIMGVVQSAPFRMRRSE